MQKVILNTCFIGAMFVACGDVGESYQVEKFGNSRINVLYQGEGMGKILKVTANRGNCKIYDANYRESSFKNGNNLVSSKEKPKFCYTDINKEIGVFLSKSNNYSCNDLSRVLKNDLSTVTVYGIYKYIPYTKEQKQQFYNIVKTMNEFKDVESQIYQIIYNFSDSYGNAKINIGVKSLEDIFRLAESWGNNQDYYFVYGYSKEIVLSPFTKAEEGLRGMFDAKIIPLENSEKAIVKQAFNLIERYKKLEKDIEEYDKTQQFDIPSVYVLNTYNSWKENKMHNGYIKPYHFFKKHTQLDQDEIKKIKELEKQLYYDYYVELKYGNKASFNVKDCSKILEVEITTDKGSATYKF